MVTVLSGLFYCSLVRSASTSTRIVPQHKQLLSFDRIQPPLLIMILDISITSTSTIIVLVVLVVLVLVVEFACNLLDAIMICRIFKSL